MYNRMQDENGTTRADILEELYACKDKQAFEAMLQRQQKLASLGLLVGSIAHEINNPLTTVVNCAQAIADSVPVGCAAHACSTEMLKASAWIAALVQSMLSIVREEPRRSDSASMLEIVNASLLLVRPILHRNEVEVAIHCAPDLPLVVCRAQEIQQVLMNLLTNACDALNARYPSRDPNKTVSVSLHWVATDGRDWVRTTVEDRGEGMTPDVQARIFSPFFTSKKEKGGVGLGLWICQSIVRDHQGKLWVESEVGRYTRFHLDIPVDGAGCERQIRVQQQESGEAFEGPKPVAGREPKAERRADEWRSVS